MSNELASLLYEMTNILEMNLGYVAQALENANKLKAIELYKKVNPKIGWESYFKMVFMK